MNKGKRKINYKKPLVSLSLLTIFGLVLGMFAYSLNISFPEIKNAALNPLTAAKAQVTSLYLTNVHITSLASTSANIAWETNLFSDSKVEIGETTNYEISCATCSSSSFVKTHNITIGGLDPGKTYHYRVISKTETGESKTSLDRTFTTPTSTSDTIAPLITYMAAEVTGSDANIIVHTTEDSHVTVYYSLSPIVDLFAPGVFSADDNAIPHRILHTIGLSGLTLSTTYYYRVQAVDLVNNSFTTGEFTFTTAGAGDYTFTTGVCAGGVPIGGCTSEQYYCDAGTATLVHNCEHCGYLCPAGQTCLPGGVCSNDPTLTDDPYQCNRAECYKNCQGISPVQSCTSDTECPGVPCVDDGVFNSPAPSNCFSTYARCDANVILKVKRDRECDKWLECGTAIELTDPKTGQKEEVCMDLAICTALGEGNQCVSYVDLPKSEVTFRTPENIKDIKWLTGAITAGLDWSYQEGAPIIKGFFPWSAMTEEGGKLRIDNWNFENTKIKTKEFTSTDYPSKTRNIETYDISKWQNFSKYPDNEENLTSLSTDWENKANRENRILKVELMEEAGQGVSIRANGGTSASSEYILSLRIKSSNISKQKVNIRLSSGGSSPNISDFGTYTLTTGWQEILTQPIKGVGGQDTYIEVILSEGSNTQTFLLDDIKLEPALEVKNDLYLQRSCRLYPKENSASCEYYDDNGIFNKGWYGYCLERDPQNENKCISWWPVDILKYEGNLFGQEESAGYTGRNPVYMCLESEGGNTRLEINSFGLRCRHDCDPCTGFHWGSYDLGVCAQGSCDNGVSIDGFTAAYKNLRTYDDFYHLSESQIDYGEAIRFDSCHDDENSAGWTIDIDDRSSGIWDHGANMNKIIWHKYVPHKWDDHTDKIHFWMVFECLDSSGLPKNCSLNDEGLFIGMAINHDDGYGDAEPVEYRFEIHTNEKCNKIVKVVTEAGSNKAWAEIINSITYKVPDLNYINVTDLSPYGGAVTGEGDPENWGLPLMVEEPNWDFSSPYQVRAGKSYASIGDCNRRVCVGGNNDGSSCISSEDCIDGSSQGLCMGVGTCSKTAQSCFMNTDCPAEEYCIGGMASNRGPQEATKWPSFGNAIRCFNVETGATDTTDCTSNQECKAAHSANPDPWYCTSEVGTMHYFAERRIRGLFARSYGIYEWNKSLLSYRAVGKCSTEATKTCYENSDCLLPGDTCMISSSTSLTSDSFYGWGPPNRLCPDGIRPKYNPQIQETYCGVPPKITNIKLGDGNSNIAKLGSDGGKVKLSFNTAVDSQQEPLKNIWINWGDSDIQHIYYGYKSKSDPENPHVYTHAYKNVSSGTTYNIRIAIEDNWEWCSSYPMGGSYGSEYNWTECTGVSEGVDCDEICSKRGLGAAMECTTSNKFPNWCAEAWDDEDDCNASSTITGEGQEACSFDFDPPDDNRWKCCCGFDFGNYVCGETPYNYWEPIDSCRDGANCVDGICDSGQDKGRSCDKLIVDLNE